MAQREESRTLIAESTNVEDPQASQDPRPGGPIDKAVDLRIGTPNVYTAVLVAAFGGLRVRISKAKGSKKEVDAKVLPFLMWLLTIPAFLAQVSALLTLRTHLDLEATVYEEHGTIWTSIVPLKLMMVVIVYLMNFKVLLKGLQHLIFIVNPLTWAEVKHADASTFLGADGAGRIIRMIGVAVVVPWPFVSLGMQIIVNYIVCTDSVSVILSSQSATDAIFNSLAIGFVVDLAGVWWGFCEEIFHFESIDSFNFELMDEWVWDRAGGGKLVDRRKQDLGPCFSKCVEVFGYLTSMPCLPKRLGIKHSVFRINHGSRRCAMLLVVMLLYMVYLRQLLVLLHALDTNVLPVARDVCTEMNLDDDHGKSVASRIFGSVESFLFVSTNERLEALEQRHVIRFGNQTMRQVCHTAWKRMTFADQLELASDHKTELVFFSFIMLSLLALPTVVHALHKYIVHGEEGAEGAEGGGDAAAKSASPGPEKGTQEPNVNAQLREQREALKQALNAVAKLEVESKKQAQEISDLKAAQGAHQK